MGHSVTPEGAKVVRSGRRIGELIVDAKWSGPAAVTGTGTFTSGQATAVNAQLLTVPRIAFTLTQGTRNNTASWNPNLVITVPAAAVAGTYTATITFSVA